MLSDRQSIYSSQVEGRSRSPAHQGAFVREILAGVRVQDFLASRQTLATLHPEDSQTTVLDRLTAAPAPVIPVVEDGDRLELLRPLLADPKENRRRRARGGQ